MCGLSVKTFGEKLLFWNRDLPPPCCMCSSKLVACPHLAHNVQWSRSSRSLLMYPQPQNVLKAQTTDYLGYYYAKPVFCLKICLRYAASVCVLLCFPYLLSQAILPKVFSFLLKFYFTCLKTFFSQIFPLYLILLE